MAIFSGPEITSNNLGLNIDFSNSRSINGTTLTDLSINKIPITLVNASTNSMNITNGYAEFNPVGVTDTHTHYSIANSYFNTIKNEISTETSMYVYDTFGNGQYGRGVSPRVVESGSPLGFSLSNGGITMETNTSTGWKTGYYSSASLSFNKWIHISQTTSVIDDSTKTYINGELVNTISFAGSIPSGGGGFLLGRGYYGGIANYKGRIGFLRVYSAKLTAAEIKQNFEAIRGRYNV